MSGYIGVTGDTQYGYVVGGCVGILGGYRTAISCIYYIRRLKSNHTGIYINELSCRDSE